MALIKYESIPKQLEHLISEEDYIEILEYCHDYLSRLGVITEIRDGVIKFDDRTEEYQMFSLDNLARILSSQDRKEWRDLVNEHFDKLYNKPEKKYDLDNFESIKDLLGVRIYPDGYFEAVNFEDRIIYRIDFEKTKSTIVFDFPDLFEPVVKEFLEKWDKSEAQLFETAIENVNKKEVEIIKNRYNNGFDLFSFFSGDYSASYLLDFENNATCALGKYGSLVMIPNRGSAFVHPIEKNNIALVIGDISQMVNAFFDEEPAPINTNYYWYYENQFAMFPTTVNKEGYTNHHIPRRLEDLLKTEQ